MTGPPSKAPRGTWPLGSTLLVGALAFACGPADGELQPRALTFGHVGNPGSLYDVITSEYARRVNGLLPEGWSVEIFGSSQLGGDEVLLQKLRLGTVDLSLPSTVMSSTIEAFGLFEMPYLVRDREHMGDIEREIVWPTLEPLVEERGYHLIAVWENGYRHVTNNVRPIRSPEDLRGIKLRTPRGVWRVKLFQAMGANPSPMSFSEVFVALQTGVMDGQENPLAQIHSAHLQEVQEYLSLTGHVYTPAFVTAGSTWERLPEAVRSILDREAKALQDFVYAQAQRMDAELLEALRGEGILVNEPDPAAFLEASRSVYDEFAATVEGGSDLVERARSLRGGGG